jgi:hypothetical protein
VLLVQVLNESHPIALEGSSVYAGQLVEGFFWKYIHIDPALVELHVHKFLGLVEDSRLEIAFVGHPTGFQAPSKHELAVVFDAEVRVIRRFTNPG